MTDFQALLKALVHENVEFIIVGGAAATAHGSARLTLDLDIVYRRSPRNLARLARAFHPLRPHPRGAPPHLPFHWDEETLRQGLNFTLTTTLGDIDIFGEIIGGGFYQDLISKTDKITLFGLECRVLSLDALIYVKRATGRPKDLEVLAELEAIREERQNN